MFQFRLCCGAQRSSSQDVNGANTVGRVGLSIFSTRKTGESSLGYWQYSAAAKLEDSPLAQCWNWWKVEKKG